MRGIRNGYREADIAAASGTRRDRTRDKYLGSVFRLISIGIAPARTRVHVNTPGGGGGGGGAGRVRYLGRARTTNGCTDARSKRRWRRGQGGVGWGGVWGGAARRRGRAADGHVDEAR